MIPSSFPHSPRPGAPSAILHWRFTLRKGVTFHDGTPFNADSVVFTLKRVHDNTKLIKSFVYQDIESVEKDGDYAVIVTSKRPFGSLPPISPCWACCLRSAGRNEEAFFQKPIGTGPFRFASWTHGDQIAMTANPTLLEAGHPKVEKVTFRFIPELSTRTAALRARRATGDRPGHPRSRRDPQGHAAASKVLDVPAIEAQRWIFQLGREPVKDQRLRQAISLAIDRSVIIKELLPRLRAPRRLPVPPGLIGHTSLPAKAYDPEKSRQILKQAGYSNVSRRHRPDEGLLSRSSSRSPRRSRPCSATWASSSISRTWRSPPRASSGRRAPTIIVLLRLGAHAPRPRLVLRPVVHQGRLREAHPLQRIPRVEQLIAEGRVPDPKVRQAKYEELERIVWDEDAELWLYYTVAIYGVSDRLRNFEARRDYYVLLSDVSIV